METEERMNPFAVPDLWRPSVFSQTDLEQGVLFSEIDFDVTQIHLQNPYAPKLNLEKDLQLPSVESFVYGPLEDLDLQEESVISTEPEVEQVDGDGEGEDDLWLLAAEPAVNQQSKFLTWESFSGDHRRAKSPYLSEAGSATFDAAVSAYYSNLSTHRQLVYPVVRSDIFLTALQHMATGRSSRLFDWHPRSNSFKPLLDRFTVHGLTPDLTKSLFDSLIKFGSMINRLRKYSEKAYIHGAMPSRVALANAISSILLTIEQHFSERMPTVRSILQLQEVIDRPGQIVQEIVDLVKALRSAKNDEQFASITFNHCVKLEHSSAWISSLLVQLLSNITRPLLDQIDSWLRLRQVSVYTRLDKPDLPYIKLLESSDNSLAEEYLVEKQFLPIFISQDMARLIAETEQGLNLLERHHPGHTLIRKTTTTSANLSLEWQTDWQNIDRIMAKARIYESELAVAVRTFAVHTESSVGNNQAFRDDAVELLDDYEAHILTSLSQFEQPPADNYSLPDKLSSLVMQHLEDTPLAAEAIDQFQFKPSITMLPMLSFDPVLRAQARLVRGACTRALFQLHNLRHHLKIQKLYHLMGDGVFISRLAAALFDPAAASTERKLGVMRSGMGMGLQLGARTSWPPASSELRLALMGILSDCYQNLRPQSPEDDKQDKKEIPGGLSFAIRNLNEDEIAKIMDPNSLYALDFLRLNYTPPSPLNTIITTLSLEKYDAIFKFILRMVRLLFVVSRLPTRSKTLVVLQFSMQARHFVDTCAQYFFDTAIHQPWSQFEQYLDDVEHKLKAEDEANSDRMQDICGLEDLRTKHDACLDKIMFGLLLRHRQQKVLSLMEGIFTAILGLHVLCQQVDPSMEEVKALHARFIEKVKLLLEVCRGLSGKKGYMSRTDGENSIEMLVTGLDYNGYYTSRK